MEDPTDRPKYSDAEKRAHDMARLDFFKGTIAITVIYATVIIIIAFVGIFSEDGYKLLFEDGYTFMVTLIVGVILVVGLLLWQIYTYKQKKKTVVSGDTYVCPDYWELKRTPEGVLQALENSTVGIGTTAGNVKGMSRFYCKDTRRPSGSGSMLVTAANPKTTENTNLSFMVNDIYGKQDKDGLLNNYRMNCGLIYPEYMEYHDTVGTGDKKKFDNKLRCEYLKQCATNNEKKIVWSGICPNDA